MAPTAMISSGSMTQEIVLKRSLAHSLAASARPWLVSARDPSPALSWLSWISLATDGVVTSSHTAWDRSPCAMVDHDQRRQNGHFAGS